MRYIGDFRASIIDTAKSYIVTALMGCVFSIYETLDYSAVKYDMAFTLYEHNNTHPEAIMKTI